MDEEGGDEEFDLGSDPETAEARFSQILKKFRLELDTMRLPLDRKV